MKKILLLFCFLLISTTFADAQLTASCTNCSVNNSVFNIYNPATATNPPTFFANPVYYLGRQNGVWNITYVSQGGYVANYFTTSPSTSMLPPCNELWKNVGTASTYTQITFSGSNCITLPLGGTPSVGPYGVVYPTFTSNQIDNILNPVVGQTVFDYSLSKLRTWNGSQWVPL